MFVTPNILGRILEHNKELQVKDSYTTESFAKQMLTCRFFHDMLNQRYFVILGTIQQPIIYQVPQHTYFSKLFKTRFSELLYSKNLTTSMIDKLCDFVKRVNLADIDLIDYQYGENYNDIIRNIYDEIYPD